MMKSRTSIVLLTVVLLSCGAFVSAWDIMHNLATKTPYEAPTDPLPPPVDGCSPVFLNVLARHGLRQPTLSATKSMINFAQRLQSYLPYINTTTVPWLQDFVMPFSIDQQGLLAPEGMLEHYELGKRISTAFESSIFSKNYTSYEYNFQSTQVPRTGTSATSFAYGAFENRGIVGDAHYQPVFVYADNDDLDFKLRFFDTCPVYRETTEKDPHSQMYTEPAAFLNRVGPGIRDRIYAHISNKTTAPAEPWLTVQDVDTVFVMCQYIASIFKDTETFCSLFNETEIEMMEYVSDLEDYWEKGYGVKLNYEIASQLLMDFLSYFESYAHPDSPYAQKDVYDSDVPVKGNLRAKLRFAHAETVFPFVSLLGLFDEDPVLTASLPWDVIANRTFKGSVIAPYAANVGMVLYSCIVLPESAAANASPYYVQMWHNEKIQSIPRCPAGAQHPKDPSYCEYDAFLNAYLPSALFDFNKVCDVPECILSPYKFQKHLDKQVILSGADTAGLIIGVLLLGGLVGWGTFALIRRRRAQKSGAYNPVQ